MDAILILLPALAWLGAIHSRPAVIQLRCMGEPTPCVKDEVPSIDRASLGLPHSPRADGLSFATQNASGYLAIGVPILLSAGQALVGAVSPAAALAMAGTDFVLLLEATVWNGLATETARLLVQRPRPFVYEDPARHAANVANYTSFYSGHTSFSATATTSLALALVGRGAPPAFVALAAAGGAVLVSLTALFRVLAGRHFVTDTLAGALAGFLVAASVALLHRPARRRAR